MFGRRLDVASGAVLITSLFAIIVGSRLGSSVVEVAAGR